MALAILVEKKSSVSMIGLMADKETPRSIRFPEKLWSAIDAEAKKCKRSSVKQMEAVLMAYYELEDTNLDLGRIAETQSVFAISATSLPRVNEQEGPNLKRKRS